jgi:hypothetical protein
MMPNPVTSYTELIQSLRERVGQLELRYVDFDKLAGFPEGLTGKAFGPSQVKRLGPEKLFDALRAAGLWIRIEEDPEQAEKMRRRIADNFIPRQSNQARPNNFANLSNKIIDSVLEYLANKKGGLARLNKAVREARSNAARRASNAHWTRKRELRGIGDFAAYREACLGNVSRIGLRALPPPENREACAEEEATAA